MSSLLSSTYNTRAILPDNLHFVRSDAPYRISTQETTWLLDHDLVTVVDLRTGQERERKPCPLMENRSFRYLCMPVTGGDKIPASAGQVSQSYIHMVDGQMDQIIDTILGSDTNVLYFCNAEKDRTGVVSAILLHILHMSREYIVNDYMMSAALLEPMLDAYVRQFPDIDRLIITPQRRYIEEFLDWFCP